VFPFTRGEEKHVMREGGRKTTVAGPFCPLTLRRTLNAEEDGDEEGGILAVRRGCNRPEWQRRLRKEGLKKSVDRHSSTGTRKKTGLARRKASDKEKTSLTEGGTDLFCGLSNIRENKKGRRR